MYHCKNTPSQSSIKRFLIGTLLLISPLLAQAQPTIELLDAPTSWRNYPTGVSADGSIVVGYTTPNPSPGPFIGWIWDEVSGYQAIPGIAGSDGSCMPMDISADGTVVVGIGHSASGSDEAFRWVVGDASSTGLGDLSGGSSYSKAFAVSADGSVVVGESNSTAFRWESGTMIPLETNGVSSTANGVSGDGEIVVGFDGDLTEFNGTPQGVAVKWDATGIQMDLGYIDSVGNENSPSVAYGASSSGSVIVGLGTVFDGEEYYLPDVFRWTAADGMVSLTDQGASSSLFGTSHGYDASADGGTVLGMAAWSYSLIWTESLGIIDLATYLESEGVRLDPDEALTDCSHLYVGTNTSQIFGGDGSPLYAITSPAGAISADGSTIVGYFFNGCSGQGGPFKVQLNTEPADNTEIGNDVVVVPEPVDENGDPVADVIVSLDFDEVTASGDTTVVVSTEGPLLPTGFKLGNPPIYVEIETTASFSGNVEICIDYSQLTFAGDPMDLVLAHYNDPNWEDITQSNADEVICGITNNFSPFVILETSNPIDLIDDLVDAVAALNAKKGIINSFDKKLEHARDALTDAKTNNDHYAMNVLVNAFINSVEAQRSKHITNEEADDLISRAEEIAFVLNGATLP